MMIVIAADDDDVCYVAVCWWLRWYNGGSVNPEIKKGRSEKELSLVYHTM